MNETHPLVAEIGRLNALERSIINKFIHRQRVARDLSIAPMSFGDRVRRAAVRHTIDGDTCFRMPKHATSGPPASSLPSPDTELC